jgi:nucleoside-diphosphate-sugar epimerase
LRARAINDISSKGRINGFLSTLAFGSLTISPFVLFTPIETYSTNVMDTAYLLEAIRHAGNVKVIVNSTSDKNYGNKE